MQDEGDAEFVMREFGEEPGYEFRVVSEERICFPGGVDRDEFVAGAPPGVFSVVESAGRSGEEPVVAGVTGEKGEWEGVGAVLAEPVVLFEVGQRDGAGDQATLVLEGAVGEPEDLLVPGSTACCIRFRGEFSEFWILSRAGCRRDSR